METIRIIAQLIVGLGLLNVWILRREKKTPYRGGDSSTMREEFAAYGLGVRSMWVVGGLKIVCAIALLIGIYVPELVLPSASVLVALMLGAVAMHLKAEDPLVKFLPSAAVLVLCLFLALNAQGV